VRLAISTALLSDPRTSADLTQVPKSRIGVWLVAARQTDLAGKLWNAHAPLHAAPSAGEVAHWLALSPTTPILFDAVYADQDDEYLDTVALEHLLPKP
jgi:hypothetical protein